MSYFDISGAVFNNQLRELETSDPAHADVFNAVFRQLINNDVALMEAASMFAGQKNKQAEFILNLKRTGKKYGVHHSAFDVSPLSAGTRTLDEVLAKEAADELWTAKVGLFQVASIPGRGQAYGKKYIERWMSRDPEGTKYCVQSDIKKCYPSMSHDKILEFLRRDLGKSDMLLYLFETLIGLYSEAKVQNKEKDCKHGIFIGSPVSKDLCNYYLSYLYHYCTNELYEMKTRRGKTTRKRLIYHIMIQMDDIILFGSNKKDLHKAMLLVIEFVKSTLCLKIKDSWSLFRTGYVDRNGKQKGRDLDYMGLVFHGQNLIKRCYSGKTVTIRNVSTRIRASIFLKARRKIHRFAKKIKNKKIIGSKFAMSTIAYNGWFVTTDSFLVRVAECWDQLISMAKNIISRYAKQKSYAMEKYYKKWRKLNYA